MMPLRRNTLAAQRFADRKRREDDAPRLSAQVPALRNLRIAFEEQFGSGATKHIRRFVVGDAPALFIVQCGDPRCTDGEHDLTPWVMHALRTGQPSFHGSDDCTGNLGSSYCSRVLRFDGTAEYAPR
jgi:hypothetical protein